MIYFIVRVRNSTTFLSQPRILALCVHMHVAASPKKFAHVYTKTIESTCESGTHVYKKNIIINNMYRSIHVTYSQEENVHSNEKKLYSSSDLLFDELSTSAALSGIVYKRKK